MKKQIDYKKTKLHIMEICAFKGISTKDLQRELGYDSIQAVYRLLNTMGKKEKLFLSLERFLLLCEYLEIAAEDLIVWKLLE